MVHFNPGKNGEKINFSLGGQSMEQDTSMRYLRNNGCKLTFVKPKSPDKGPKSKIAKYNGGLHCSLWCTKRGIQRQQRESKWPLA